MTCEELNARFKEEQVFLIEIERITKEMEWRFQ